MLELMTNWFQVYGVEKNAAHYIAVGILLVLMVLLSMAAYFISRTIVLRVLSLVIRNNKFKWDDILLERRVFHKLCNIVPAMILYSFAPAFPALLETLIKKFSSVYIILAGILVIDAILNAVDDIYKTYEIAKNKPIKGYLQVAKIFIYTIGGILMIAAIIEKSPLLLLSGIGALTAVLLIVFKDSLLGLVAGIQLSSNDMIRLGDWIEMPKYGANGDVIDISLNTVKIENFDKTITTIPTYALVSDSFKNWRGMVQAGGRRINRSIYIDVTSVTFCTDEMLEKFEKIHYLADYIKGKKAEITRYNLENNIDSTEAANGRRLTNLGTFRAYIQSYLKNHPQIHKDMTQIVRQLPPGESGIPLDIYVFTNETNWAVYENIQSDIFDHLFAVIPEFGLRVYQKPTGYDISQPLSYLKDWPERSHGEK